jgi:hypothetical protein
LLWLFWRWVLGTICLGWPRTTVLPISASQVARITGVSTSTRITPYSLSIFFYLVEIGFFIHVYFLFNMFYLSRHSENHDLVFKIVSLICQFL